MFCQIGDKQLAIRGIDKILHVCWCKKWCNAA